MKLLKSLIAVLLLTTIGFVSCRKETPFELTNGMEEVGLTCSNGILDANEDGVDCGPECTPCALSLASCSLTNNQFSESFTTTITTSFSTGQVVASTTSGYLVLTATSGNKYVKVTFSSSSPQMFSEYGASQFGTIASDEARLEYYSGSYLYTGYSGSIHLNKVSGKYSVEFCDVYISTPSVGGYKVADGKLTEN